MAIIDYKDVAIVRDGQTVLDGVDLTVEKGEFVYLLGRVGSGKSSLMKTMYGEVPIASGSASVLDYDLCRISRSDMPMLRRRIGIVFQDFRLLTDRSARANLDFVLGATGWQRGSERRERIESVLQSVDMLDKADLMPHQLSGGEQQRIVMARALLNEPALIIADEPTGNLDPETAEQVMDLLYRISQTNGRTVIVATHNTAFPRLFPGRILRCIDKKLLL